jgi:uncharacterized protein (UPF0332 family)
MKEFDKTDYVNYRLKKSIETLEVAELLYENSKWNSTINRLYYACFYCITTLLVKHGIETKSHSGVKSQFFLNFVKTGLIEVKYGKLYSDLFDWRQKGDYGDFFDFEKDDVIPLMKPTFELLEQIKVLIVSRDNISNTP